MLSARFHDNDESGCAIIILIGDSPMTRIMDLTKENIYQELSW